MARQLENLEKTDISCKLGILATQAILQLYGKIMDLNIVCYYYIDTDLE